MELVVIVEHDAGEFAVRVPEAANAEDARVQVLAWADKKGLWVIDGTMVLDVLEFDTTPDGRAVWGEPVEMAAR